MEKLAELEEEMCVNLVRSSYLFPIDVVEEEGYPNKKTIRFPYLKDGSYEMLQPIFNIRTRASTVFERKTSNSQGEI